MVARDTGKELTNDRAGFRSRGRMWCALQHIVRIVETLALHELHLRIMSYYNCP